MLSFNDLCGEAISRLGDEVYKHTSKSSMWVYRRSELFPTMTRPEIAIVLLTIVSPYMDYSLMRHDYRELRYCVTEDGKVRCVDGDTNYLYHYRYPVEKWLKKLLEQLPQRLCKERSALLKEPLAAAVWHPHRVQRILDAYGWEGVDAMG